jgi:hypothetical protein
MAIPVYTPSCAAAVPDLHSPVKIVGRNCEYHRDRGHDHHSEQHANQKYPHHFSIHETPFCFVSVTDRSVVLFMARAADFPVPLANGSVLSLLGELIPTVPYLSFVTRRQGGSV